MDLIRPFHRIPLSLCHQYRRPKKHPRRDSKFVTILFSTTTKKNLILPKIKNKKNWRQFFHLFLHYSDYKEPLTINYPFGKRRKKKKNHDDKQIKINRGTEIVTNRVMTPDGWRFRRQTDRRTVLRRKKKVLRSGIAGLCIYNNHKSRGGGGV